MPTAVLPARAYLKESGARLRKLIDLLEISYVDAAEIMGISKHVLRNWMAGDNPVQPYPLYRLCMVKGVDFNYVHLDDFSRLPKQVREPIEAEILSRLAQAESANQADETGAAA